MILPEDAACLLRSFDTGADGEAEKSRELLLALLAYSAEPFSREVYTPGHVTCTGVVLGPGLAAVLLVHHRRLNRWLLPGGHVELGDASVADAARREVLEETGVAVCFGEARLAGVDVHPIPPNKREPLHLHHDLIFAFQAQNGEVVCSAESRDVVWCGLEDLDKYELPGSIRRSIKRAGFDAALNCIGVSG